MPQTALKEQFYQGLVRNGACVLADAKPAALFSFVPRAAALPLTAGAAAPSRATRPSRPAFPASPARPVSRNRLAGDVRDLCADFNARFAERGLRCDTLLATASRALLLLSRPGALEALLADPASRAFLAQAGYAVQSPAGVLASLRGRFAAYGRRHAGGDVCMGACLSCAFPHEVGLLLGYPLEDVRGFIEHGGRQATAAGPWKSYGDPAQARAHWDRLATCKRSVIRNYANGVPFEALIA